MTDSFHLFFCFRCCGCAVLDDERKDFPCDPEEVDNWIGGGGNGVEVRGDIFLFSMFWEP